MSQCSLRDESAQSSASALVCEGGKVEISTAQIGGADPRRISISISISTRLSFDFPSS